MNKSLLMYIVVIATNGKVNKYNLDGGLCLESTDF